MRLLYLKVLGHEKQPVDEGGEDQVQAHRLKLRLAHQWTAHIPKNRNSISDPYSTVHILFKIKESDKGCLQLSVVTEKFLEEENVDTCKF